MEESQVDFSEVFPDCEIEEKSGDFYQTPASPITVPYCRPSSQGISFSIWWFLTIFDKITEFKIYLLIQVHKSHQDQEDKELLH